MSTLSSTSEACFARVLVANRGEIAVRIAQTLKDQGTEPIGVYTQADSRGLHLRGMARAICLDSLGEGRGYLDVDALIAAAQQTQAEAIHPGYGFVSENPALAHACEAAGIVLVGPSAHAITIMGSKTSARAAMQAAQVPVIPGTPSLQDLDQARQAAAAMGYPIMLKAAAGGGGKGIRIVDSQEQLAGAWRAVRSEARSAFGDETIYMEKALIEPRHIEVQVIADHHGQTFAVGERECSMQRRHQKIIEEAPAAHLSEDLRQKLAHLACRAAEAVSYVGAGTVEFLLDARGEVFFLEMNTRLQVEHPVTEMCHGLDLVALQLRVARGQPLNADQLTSGSRGHAIEARLYAEDPSQGFLPAPGRVESVEWPMGPGVRVDRGVAAGCEVTTLFDPMIAKLIAWGPTREEARRRLLRAIAETHVRGLTTNRSYLISLLSSAPFVAGRYHTHTLEQLDAPTERVPLGGPAMQAATTALILQRFFSDQKRQQHAGHLAPTMAHSAWAASPWRLEGS